MSWFTLEALTATIAGSRIYASAVKVVERIVRSELVVDDIGLLPAGADEAETLYRLVGAAYERRSLITSNLEFTDWTSVLAGDERLTAALLDRLTRRCHLLEFRGSSYRFRQSLAAGETRPDPASHPLDEPAIVPAPA